MPLPFSGTETILIVDDDFAVLDLTHLILRHYGYSSIPASSGKEALHLLAGWPDLQVNLVIADIIMPDMSGIELAEKIHVLRPALRVLFFSACWDQEILRPVIAIGASYIAKPFMPIQLTKKVREVLDKPKTASAGWTGTE